MRESYFDRAASGDCLIEAFLTGLEAKQYFKKLEGTQGIWEVRADYLSRKKKP